jgi:Protein of unknown function (DUF3297)
MRSLPMTEAPPDRLCADPTSPFYDAALLERGVGVRFKGQEKTNVEEYCVSEGWVRLAAGNTRDRKGRPLTIKLKGEVVAYFRDGGEDK